MGAVEHASHFGWGATSRGTLDIYDRVLSLQAKSQKNIG
jgi:D-inositol-3-phosphate glycosyltransferase